MFNMTKKHKGLSDKTLKLERLQMILPLKLERCLLFLFSPNKIVLSLFGRHDLLSPHLIFSNIPFDSLVLIMKITGL